MLIICNGAFKSGSSWLHAIVVELIAIKKINIFKVPVKYTNDINSPTTIIESRLKQFIENEEYDLKNYLTKSHFLDDDTLKLNLLDNIRILSIERDIRDAIVSHFHHIKNNYRLNLSFSVYYFLLGRYKTYEIILFNSRCKKYIEDSNFFYFSDLKNNFEATVKDIALVIGIIDLSVKELGVIKEKTSLLSLREELKKGNSKYYPSRRDDGWKLFREGEIGGWSNYFSNYQLKDINKIEKGHLSVFGKLIYFFIFSFRRIIFKIE